MNLIDFLLNNKDAIKYFEHFNFLDYNKRNKIEAGTGLMSLCAVVGGYSGVAFASDTRSVKQDGKGNIINCDDQYQKIHKIQDNLYLMIMGSNSYNGEPIINLIKEKNPKTFSDLEYLIRKSLNKKSSTLYVILYFQENKMICESVNVFVNNKKGDSIVLTEYPIFTKRELLHRNQILTFGAEFLTNTFSGFDFNYAHLYLKEEIIKEIKDIMHTGYYLSKINTYHSVNNYIDLYYFDYDTGEIECVEKHSIEDSPHTNKDTFWEGLL